MKTSQLRLVLLMALLFGALTTVEAKPDKKVVTFSVEIDCENCKQKIERNLAYEKGILNLEASVKKNTVIVTYDAAKTNVEKLTEAFKKLGYEAKVLPEKRDDAKNRIYYLPFGTHNK